MIGGYGLRTGWGVGDLDVKNRCMGDVDTRDGCVGDDWVQDRGAACCRVVSWLERGTCSRRRYGDGQSSASADKDGKDSEKRDAA